MLDFIHSRNVYTIFKKSGLFLFASTILMWKNEDVGRWEEEPHFVSTSDVRPSSTLIIASGISPAPSLCASGSTSLSDFTNWSIHHETTFLSF